MNANYKHSLHKYTVQSTKWKFDKNLKDHYPPFFIFQQLNIKLSESLAGKYCLRNEKELDIRLFSAIYVGVGPIFKTLMTVYVRYQSYK